VNLETSYSLTFPRLQWNSIIQNENNPLCLYPSSDPEQAIRVLTSIWPSFSYLVSGSFLLNIKPHDQHLTRLGTRAVQDQPSAGLGSGAAAAHWDGQTTLWKSVPGVIFKSTIWKFYWMSH